MPEGHSLHRIARDLHAVFADTIVHVTSPQGRFAEGAALLDHLRLDHAEAWGKHLFVEFDADRWLWIHLGLIGSFTIDDRPYAGEVAVVGQVRLRLANGAHVADLRGPMVCDVVGPDKVEEVLARLGPDPLRSDQDPGLGWDRISRSTRTIAELLMDQSVLAGVGNVYRSEVLFRQRVNPLRPGREIRQSSWRAIWEDLVELMPLGVATGKIITMPDQVQHVRDLLAGGGDLGNEVRESFVYQRAGEACLVCGSRIRTRVVAGRNLFWCGWCQRRR